MSAIDPAKKPSKTVVYEVTDSSPTSSVSHEEAWSSSEEGSLDKVRDILFGAQSREFEKRFAVLENRLLEASRELRQELIQSISDLKTQMNQEVQALLANVEREQTQRVNANQEMGQTVKTLEAQLSQRLVELTKQASSQFQTFGLDMQQQKAALEEQHAQSVRRLEAEHQHAIKELKIEKTDRAALAEMLMEIALRLKVGPKEPDAS